MSKKETIKLTGWEIIGMIPLLEEIGKMRLVASGAVSNLNYIIRKIFKIENDNKLRQTHYDLVKKYATTDEENPKTLKVDESKMADYVKEGDELFGKEFDIERWCINYSDFFDTKFDLPMDQWYVLDKIIDFEK